MGMSAETLRQWGRTASVVREEAWPPFVRPEPGTRVELVVRWNENARVGFFGRWFVRLYFLATGINLTPQQLEFIGPASSEEAARAACLDSSYCSFPMTVDRFLPKEPVNLSGVRYWKRRLHRLFWLSEPEAVDEYELVRRSELERLKEGAGRLIKKCENA